MKNKSYVTKKVDSIETKELEGILLSNKNKSSKKVLKDNEDYIIDEDKKFSCYVKDLIKEKGLTIKDVIYNTGESENYGRKIISQEKSTKDRNLIIRICVAANLSVKETNRALKLYGMKGLYAKDKRDAVIMIEINKGNRTIEDIDDALIDNNLEILSKKLKEEKDD